MATSLSSTTQHEVVLLAAPSAAPLAKQVVDIATTHGWPWRQSGVTWKWFPDGTPNLFVENIDGVRGRDVVFLACFHSAQAIFAQLAVIYALPSYMVRSLTVVLPYFPTATMERIDEEGQIATAKTLARMLSAIPMTNAGPTRLICFDIHALQERFYFQDSSIIPLLPTAVPLLIDRLQQVPDDVAIIFPDDGACKRFGKLFPQYPIVTCAKVREGDARIVRIKEGNPAGKHCFIVDDIAQTGGTLIECKEALLHAGASKVSAYVTHAVFPNESWRKFLTKPEDPHGFQHFFVTDSNPEVSSALQGQAPFEVLSIAGKIADNVHRFVTCFH